MLSLVESITNIKTDIVYITHSAIAYLNLFTAALSKTMSIIEDSRLFLDE
jgi:hypothetical protein